MDRNSRAWGSFQRMAEKYRFIRISKKSILLSNHSNGRPAPLEPMIVYPDEVRQELENFWREKYPEKIINCPNMGYF